MKTIAVQIVVLALIALASTGCSSSPRIYYWMGKAYVRNPETGKMISREYKAAEGRGYPMCVVPGPRISMGNPMSGYKPNIDCSNIQVPCSIK